MQWDKRSMHIGVGFLAAALLIRLLAAAPLAGGLSPPGMDQLLSAMVFMETGRILRPPAISSPEPAAEAEVPTQPPGPLVISQPQLPLVLSVQDLSLLEIHNAAGLDICPEEMLRQGTAWDLTQEGPAVLIIHTHGTESYRNLQGYVETASFRTQDENNNMISIGKEIARILQEGGIQVIHDTTAYDAASYSDAYSRSRQAIRSALAQYPSIRLILDIHRDAAEDAQGNQVAYTSQLGGQTAAQLMLVVGSNAGGLTYPNWQDNLTLAVQLQTALQRRSPGICRPLNFRPQRYNQDLHPGSILVEVGSAGNTHDEAMLAAQALAEGILDMAHGVTYAQ